MTAACMWQSSKHQGALSFFWEYTVGVNAAAATIVAWIDGKEALATMGIVCLRNCELSSKLWMTNYELN